MRREFTGRDMAKILVAGFGVVIAVNFTMAALASRSFSGTVVDNSYIASQKFNGWLEDARRAEELGWSAEVQRDASGFITVATDGVPQAANVTAELRRPIGGRETVTLDFASATSDTYRSVRPIDGGRWKVRLAIQSGDERWSREVPIE